MRPAYIMENYLLYSKSPNINNAFSVAQPCLTFCNPMDCSSPGLCLWNFAGRNTGMGCHFLSSKNTLAEIYKMFDHIPGQHGSAKLTYKINHLSYDFKKKYMSKTDKASPSHSLGLYWYH